MAATTVQQPWPSSRRAWYGVTMFGLTVMTLFGSNALIGLLVQPIKVDLGLTDTQVSLIVGFAAAAFNAIASLPISRLVDRMSRRLIIGVGLLVDGHRQRAHGPCERLLAALCGAPLHRHRRRGQRTGDLLDPRGLLPAGQAAEGNRLHEFRLHLGNRDCAVARGNPDRGGFRHGRYHVARDRRRAWVAARVPGDGNSGSDTRPPDADHGLRAAAARPARWPRAQVIAPHQSAPCSRISGASGRPSDPCSWDSRATRSPWGHRCGLRRFTNERTAGDPHSTASSRASCCC